VLGAEDEDDDVGGFPQMVLIDQVYNGWHSAEPGQLPLQLPLAMLESTVISGDEELTVIPSTQSPHLPVQEPGSEPGVHDTFTGFHTVGRVQVQLAVVMLVQLMHMNTEQLGQSQ